MKRSSKGIIIVLVLAVGIFGYSQYASASQIGVTITQSHVLEENGQTATYDVELQFDNPSLLVLTAGESAFFVTADDLVIGQGKLAPFVLPPLGSTTTGGTFQMDSDQYDDMTLKISGTTKYDMLFTSLEIPFVYYPDEAQIRAFIDRN